MSQYINENKAYKMAHDIWSKHFRRMMPFDNYYMQIKPQLITYFSLPGVMRPMFNRMLDNRVRQTHNQLQKLKNTRR